MKKTISESRLIRSVRTGKDGAVEALRARMAPFIEGVINEECKLLHIQEKTIDEQKIRKGAWVYFFNAIHHYVERMDQWEKAKKSPAFSFSEYLYWWARQGILDTLKKEKLKKRRYRT